MEEQIIIKYKGSEFTLQDLKKQNNDFATSLELPNEFLVNLSRLPYAMCGDIGYILASEKFHQLYSLIATARFALISAHQKIHKHLVQWESGSAGQFWLRSQYLKNAILWYDSCKDYFLQIIFFAFDFKPIKKANSRKDYETLLKQCRWEKMKPELAKKAEAAVLLERLTQYKSNDSVTSVRNLSNSLKHHAHLLFKEIHSRPDVEITDVNGFTSKFIEPERIGIDETVLLLADVHHEVIAFGKFLLEFIDFGKIFTEGKDRIIDLSSKKPKEEYKKFFFH
ncbi:MAG TPA: hypothetical protein VGE26_11410 [Sphingobacteriaceae bacterium]